MNRFPTLTLLLTMMLAVAACGGSDTGQSERSAPTEPQQTQAESAAQNVPEETAREEATQEVTPADDEAVERAQGSTQEGEEFSGLSVTTIEGEEVKLGGQGDVTALFFMAGW